jgi:hypothetical protein
VSFLVRKLGRLVYEFDTVEKAPQACFYLAFSPEQDGIIGKYFNNDNHMIASSAASYHKAAALRL